MPYMMNYLLDCQNSLSNGLRRTVFVGHWKKEFPDFRHARRSECQYSTTLSRYQDGVIQTNTMFRKDMGRDAMALNIKQIKQEGYTQTEIASMLGISQPSVSNYLRR